MFDNILVGIWLILTFLIAIFATWNDFKSKRMLASDPVVRMKGWFNVFLGYLVVSFFVVGLIGYGISYLMDFLASIILWIVGIGGLLAILGILGYMQQQSEKQENFNRTPYLAAVGMIVVLMIGSFGYSMFSSQSDKQTKPANMAAQSQKKQVISRKEETNNTYARSESSPAPAKREQVNRATDGTNNAAALKMAMQELEYYDVRGEATATSYGHNKNGFLTKFGDVAVIFCDKVNNRAMLIMPADTIQQIADYKGSANKKIRFALGIHNDGRDNDAVNGSWENNDHYLPVEVEFRYENGKHIPGMIKSEEGSPTGKYDKYLYERKNVDTINLIIEEATAMR